MKVQLFGHLNVYRKGDIVKEIMKKALVCPKMYQGWGGGVGHVGWGRVGWVMKYTGGVG